MRGIVGTSGLLVCGMFILIGSVMLASESKGGTRFPKGFRLRNETLLRWGESREDVRTAAGSILTADGSLPAVSCDEETRKWFLGDSPEDCLLAADATPKPYGGGCQLMFNKDRFYGVRVTLTPQHFGEAEGGITDALGLAPSRRIGTVQNRFGATFDQIEDTWRPEGVYMRLRKRDAGVDEGSLLMYYVPLLPRSQPKAEAAPF